MPVTHAYQSATPNNPAKEISSTRWNAEHTISIVNADVAADAAIAESKLSLNNPTHAAVTIGTNTANALSLSTQQLSIADVFVQVAGDVMDGALSTLTTYTDTSGTKVQFSATTTLNPSGNASVSGSGGLFTAQVQAGNTRDMSGNLVGISGYAIHNGSGVLSNMYGLNFLAQNLGSGTITYLRGIYVGAQSAAGGSVGESIGVYIDDLHAGNVTTNYGLLINNIDGGSANYAIKTALGPIYFGDKTTIVNTANSGQDEVLRLWGGGNSGGPFMSFFSYYGAGAYPNWKLGQMDAAYVGADGSYAGNIFFQVNSGAGESTMVEVLRLRPTYLEIADAKNISLGTTTGTKIGTSASQKIGFFNATPVVQPSAYTASNVTTDRSYDANSTTIDELADVLGTLVTDLKSLGLIG